MYGRGDSTPFCGESSQSLLDFLNCSSESQITDFHELNLAAAGMVPFSSESFIPAIPSLGAHEDDECGTDDRGFLIQDPQVKPFWLGTFGLPDTPAAELSGENALCPEPELMSQMSFQRPDRTSGQSGEVFKFPIFVVDSNLSPSGPSFPASLSAPPVTTPTRPSLTLEDQLISLETPPATPKQDAGIDDGQLFQRRPTLPPGRRARLGGVSAVSASGSDPEPDEQDLQQDDLDVVSPDVIETPDDVPDAPGTTSGRKMPGWEEQVLGRDSDDPFVDDVVFYEGDGPGPASESHASASATASMADFSNRMKRAWKLSQGLQKLEPLLKEELRLMILKRRLDSGQEELDDEVTEPSRYQMTEEEHAKRDVRRAQNRGAARRFRQKKKQNETELKKKLEDSVAQHRQLTRDVDALRREVACLRALLDQHRQCGDCRLQQAVCRVAPGDAALHVPDVTALCRQIDALEDIDVRPR